MKISFHAFLKNETVLELWLKTIKRSIKFMVASGQIPKAKFSKKTQFLFKLEEKSILNLANIVKLQVQIENNSCDDSANEGEISNIL